MTGTFSKKVFYVAFWPFYFCAHPFLHCSDLSDLMLMSSSPCCLPPPPSHLPPVSRFCAHPFLSSHRFTIFEFDVYVVLSLLPCHPLPSCRVICHQCHVFVPTPSSLRSDLPYLMVVLYSSGTQFLLWHKFFHKMWRGGANEMARKF